MKMYLVREAAKELGISNALMYSLCAAGKIRHERHGLGRGTIRIPEDALEEYRKTVTVIVPIGGASVLPRRPLRDIPYRESS